MPLPCRNVFIPPKRGSSTKSVQLTRVRQLSRET